MGEALLVLQDLAKAEVIMIEWLICQGIDRVLLTDKTRGQDPVWHTQTRPVLSPEAPPSQSPFSTLSQ